MDKNTVFQSERFDNPFHCLCFVSCFFDTETGEGSTVQRKRSHVTPGKLEAPLLPDLLKYASRSVREGSSEGSDTVLIPFISMLPRSSSHTGPWFFSIYQANAAQDRKQLFKVLSHLLRVARQGQRY